VKLSNGNWEIDPEIGQMISRVVQEHPNEAREAAKDPAELKKFFKKYNEDKVLDLLDEHPNIQEQVKRIVKP